MSSSSETAARTGFPPRPSPAIDARFLRRVYLGIALAVIVFTFYGSLIPFDLRPLPLRDSWVYFQAALARRPRRVSRSDVIANALLFVPFGFALLGSRLAGRSRAWPTVFLTIVLTLIAGASVSVTVEFLQTFAPRRVPSLLDIIAQTAGSIVGVVLWLVAGGGLSAWIQETARTHAREDRFVRLLTAVVVAWVFVNLAPFDVTVDLGDLARRVRTGRIALVPFAASPQPMAVRLWGAFADGASAMPLGILGVLYWRRRGHDAPLRAFLSGAALVVAVECAQIFVASHAATTEDVISGCVGVAAGVFAAVRLLHPATGSLFRDRQGVSMRAVAAVAIWCVVLTAYHWAPYDFGVDRAMIKRKLARMSLLPFGGYRGSSYLSAFNDVLAKLSLSVPLGVSIAHVSRHRRWMRRAVIIAWLMFSACLFGVIEAGQLLLPTRTPDLTDIMMGVTGTYGGLRLARWLHDSTPPSAGRGAAGTDTNHLVDAIRGDRSRP